MENGILLVVEELIKPYNISHTCFHFEGKTYGSNQTANRIGFIIRSLTNWLEVQPLNVQIWWKEVLEVIERTFFHFIRIALKSAHENKYWLRLIGETGGVGQKKLDDLIIEANEISKINAAIL